MWGEAKTSVGSTSACCLAKMLPAILLKWCMHLSCPLVSFFLQSIFVSTRIVLQHLEIGKLHINFGFVTFVEKWQL